MYVKLIMIIFAQAVLKQSLSSEILSRHKIDNSETDVETNFNLKDEESSTIMIFVPTISVNSESSDGRTEANPLDSNEESSGNRQTSYENNGGFVLMPMTLTEDLNVNLDHARDPEIPTVDNLRLSIFTSNGNGFQIFDSIDRRRLGNNREESHLIDQLKLPQMQFVDNTLRFEAIKSSVDDLASKLFPTLHLVRRSVK